VWSDVKVIQSADANVEKWVFSTEGDRPTGAEAVLYKYPTYEERTVICCSTQSGCPVGCRFCGAGDYFVRSLTAEEIVGQPKALLEGHDIDAGAVDRMQIMFMSMGEPLLNLKELDPAIRALALMYPKAALLISTSAPRVNYVEVRNLSVAVPTVGLQFSVHESTDEARDRLIPFKAKLTLSEIADEGVRWADATGRSPFFNYCAHAGNSSEADADRLAALFNPGVWQATISVVCEREESVAAANERQRELATSFEQLLAQRGYSTRTFDPAGQDDIGGGCGQLWFVQEWMRRHPERARPSVGNGLPVVHTPAPVAA
jgi:23S rRNA (adenine2503-C2)-methyltransferase